jgi:hypothetical protein
MRSNGHLHIENPHRNHRFWHKVQIHCHSQESDAKRGQTPAIVEAAYRDAGYSCVFLTDHNRVTPSPGVPSILHIDSAEYGMGRHHTLALDIDRPAGDQHRRDHRGTEGSALPEDEFGIESITGCACGNIPKRLDYIARIQRAIPVAAHPNARHFCSGPLCPRWCGGGWSPLEMVTYAQHCAGLEIFNANNAARRMWSLNRWDEALARGARKIWGFATDDCHDVRHERTFDRGWILVNSEIDPEQCRNGVASPDALRRDILENIRSGNFWAVVRLEARRHKGQRATQSQNSRPWLAVSHSQGQISVVADRPCETIEFCAGSSSRRESTAASGSADFAYDVGDWEDYVRVRVVQKSDDGQCLMAFSQPLSVRRE